MHCPRCFAEYPQEVVECPNCSVALASGPPPGPRVEFVTVLVAGDSFALSLAKASLEDTGIPYIVSGDDPNYVDGRHWPIGLGPMPLTKCAARIEVAREFENEARALIEPLAHPEAPQDS